MLNQTILIGRLTRDPELRKTQKNQSVTNINIACDTGFDDKKQTDYINCVVWNKQADFVSQYLKKGSLVAIQGKIQSRSWEDATGKKQYVQEVLVRSVMSLESKSRRNNDQQSSKEIYNELDIDNMNDDSSALDISSDELPF